MNVVVATAPTVEPIEIPIARVGHRVALGARMLRLSNIAVVVLASLIGCASEGAIDDEDGRDDSFTTDGKLDGFQCTPAEAAAILQVANTASLATLKTDVMLSDKAADNIVAVRKGDDEVVHTADDVEFGTLAQLDAVPYIGPTAFAKLLQYVHDADLVAASPAPSGQWTTTTIANGVLAGFALAPDGDPVIAFATNGGPQLRLANGTVIAMPPEYVLARNINVAVDGAGDPHVVFRRHNSESSFTHIAYRNGAWTTVGDLAAQQLWLDQSPDGKLFALAASKSCSNCYSNLTLYGLTGAPTTEALWTVSDTWRLGFAVGLDGFPAVAWDDRHHARRNASGWTSLDIAPSAPTHQLATTGGANATVFGIGHDLRVYRQNGTAFDALQHDTGSFTRIEATADGEGTAHACFIQSNNVVHVQVTTTGAVTRTTLGNGEGCAVATDRAGKVHMVTHLGNVINHAVYE